MDTSAGVASLLETIEENVALEERALWSRISIDRAMDDRP
jgi:hypothetical protein